MQEFQAPAVVEMVNFTVFVIVPCVAMQSCYFRWCRVLTVQETLLAPLTEIRLPGCVCVRWLLRGSGNVNVAILASVIKYHLLCELYM